MAPSNLENDTVVGASDPPQWDQLYSALGLLPAKERSSVHQAVIDAVAAIGGDATQVTVSGPVAGTLTVGGDPTVLWWLRLQVDHLAAAATSAAGEPLRIRLRRNDLT